MLYIYDFMPFVIYFSVRSLKEDEWILDPVVIADVYGPEVCLSNEGFSANY